MSIHTNMLELSPDSINASMVQESGKFYRGAFRTMITSKFIKFEEINDYGAYLVDDYGDKLSKKKLRWSEIALVLFNVCSMRDKDKVKRLSLEMIKHGMIKVL